MAEKPAAEPLHRARPEGGTPMGAHRRRVSQAGYRTPELCVDEESLGDRRRAFLRGVYSRSLVLRESVVGSSSANRKCHSVGQSQRGNRDAD